MFVRLVDFLNDKQRDPRLNEILYPHYNDARVSHNHLQHHHGRGRKSHTHKILAIYEVLGLWTHTTIINIIII